MQGRQSDDGCSFPSAKTPRYRTFLPSSLPRASVTQGFIGQHRVSVKARRRNHVYESPILVSNSIAKYKYYPKLALMSAIPRVNRVGRGKKKRLHYQHPPPNTLPIPPRSKPSVKKRRKTRQAQRKKARPADKTLLSATMYNHVTQRKTTAGHYHIRKSTCKRRKEKNKNKK